MKYLHFVLKTLTRNQVRTVLTILSIMVAFILFGVLQALHKTFTTSSDPASAERLLTRHKIPVQQMPFSYVRKIEQINGVKVVTHGTWFGAYYQEPRNWIGINPVDPVAHPQVYTGFDISDEHLRAWQANRMGAVVGEEMMQRFEWKVGDRIPLISVLYSHSGGDYAWEFEIVGIFSDKKKVPGSTNYMHFRYDYFNEARDFNKDKVGWINFILDDPSRAAEISKEVDVLFANSAAETETSTEQAAGQIFMKQLGDLGMIINLILSAVFLPCY